MFLALADSMIPINIGYLAAIAITGIAGFFVSRLYKHFDALEKEFKETKTIVATLQQWVQQRELWITERDKWVKDVRDDLNRRINKLEERTETRRNLE